MKQNEPVSKIMSTDLKTVQVGQKLSEVRKLLSESDLHHVPVLSGKKLVGLFSSSDIMRLTFDAGNSDPRATDAVLDSMFTVEATMTKTLTTIKGTDSVRHAAELLVKGTLHSLPVVEAGGDLVGIVTSTDLIRYLLEQY